jgi:hypothetical protein
MMNLNMNENDIDLLSNTDIMINIRVNLYDMPLLEHNENKDLIIDLD